MADYQMIGVSGCKTAKSTILCLVLNIDIWPMLS